METAAAPVQPLSGAQFSEPPKRPRPLSSYRKPVPTEAELELRQQRRSRMQSIIDTGAGPEPGRMALDMPRGINTKITSRGAHETLAPGALPHSPRTSWRGPLLPQARVMQQEAPPPPMVLATWFWLVLERIKRIGRSLLAA